MRVLFTIPISTYGKFTCAAPLEGEKIYLLTFSSPPDNKIGPAFIDAFLLSLDIVEHRLPRGVVITTSGINKFYSNGMDIQAAKTTDSFWEKLWSLPRRLLTYPMPTVALINGHAFAGGLTLAMYHDYRIQNPNRGFICLNEAQIGVTLKPPMTSIFREKVPSPVTLRTLLLEAKRFSGPVALDAGLVDALGGLEETIQLIRDRKLLEMTKSSVYAGLREGMYQKTLELLDNINGNDAWRQRIDKTNQFESEKALLKVQRWENEGKRAKL